MLTAKIYLLLIFSIPLVYGLPIQESLPTESPHLVNELFNSSTRDELVKLNIIPLGPTKTETSSEDMPGEGDPDLKDLCLLYHAELKSNGTKEIAILDKRCKNRTLEANTDLVEVLFKIDDGDIPSMTDTGMDKVETTRLTEDESLNKHTLDDSGMEFYASTRSDSDHTNELPTLIGGIVGGGILIVLAGVAVFFAVRFGVRKYRTRQNLHQRF